MIFSMTGYGRAEGLAGDRQVTVEIKSVNGKQFEIINRMNPLLKAYEAEIRNELMKILKRGSVDVSIVIKQDGIAKPMQVNPELAKTYFRAMRQIADDLNLDIQHHEAELLGTVMRMPEVVTGDSDTVTEEEWQNIKALLQEAATALMAHRASEGQTIETDILQRVRNIADMIENVESHEGQRMERIRSRIQESLQQMITKEKIDQNRFEQELIYYMEKIDFSEEKQRLRTHCNYYTDMIAQADSEGIGKKTGFVLQEIGREINTLGSKANDAAIQQIVVNMKDELEKAKEQALNVM